MSFVTYVQFKHSVRMLRLLDYRSDSLGIELTNEQLEALHEDQSLAVAVKRLAKEYYKLEDEGNDLIEDALERRGL